MAKIVGDLTDDKIVQSFNTLGYSGVLYNKATSNTPLLNLIGGNVKYTNSTDFVCGQYYTGEDAVIPEISETASLTAPQGSLVARSQITNTTQIFQESFGVSYAKQSNVGTLSGVNVAGQVANPQDEIDFQAAVKMDKIKKSIEKTFIQGTYNKATTDTEVNKTRGIIEAITTNVKAAAGKALSLWTVDEVVRGIRSNGGDISNLFLFVNSANELQLTGEAIQLGYRVDMIDDVEYGISIQRLLLPIGARINIVLGEYIPDGTALIINPAVMGPVEQPTPGKGNFFVEELSKVGAGSLYQIFGQIGLDHGPEWYHGKITGLSTEFTAPIGLRVETVEPSA